MRILFLFLILVLFSSGSFAYNALEIKSLDWWNDPGNDSCVTVQSDRELYRLNKDNEIDVLLKVDNQCGEEFDAIIGLFVEGENKEQVSVKQVWQNNGFVDERTRQTFTCQHELEYGLLAKQNEYEKYFARCLVDQNGLINYPIFDEDVFSVDDKTGEIVWYSTYEVPVFEEKNFLQTPNVLTVKDFWGIYSMDNVVVPVGDSFLKLLIDVPHEEGEFIVTLQDTVTGEKYSILDPTWSGAGTEGDPFIITTCQELQDIDPDGLEDDGIYFELGNDIDCTGFSWATIGDVGGTAQFQGFFDGKNFSISNVTQSDGSGSMGGTFMADIGTTGVVGPGGEFRNVAFVDFNFWLTGQNGAGVFGQCDNCILENLYVQGGNFGMDGALYAAALVAQVVETSSVINSYVFDASVYAEDDAQRIGGLIGMLNGADANVFNSYSNAYVEAENATATSGFVGGNFAGTCTNNFYDTETSGHSDSTCSTPKTTANMFKEATFTNWDFSTIWSIEEDVNYPILQSFGPSPPGPTVPDLNITTINGLDYKTQPVFAYGLDGNITIEFNVSEKDNNRLIIDLNYSQSVTQGSGIVIVKDLNLTSEYCPDQNFITVSECSYSWDYSAVTDGEYAIIGLVKSTADLTDFNASDGNFEIASDVNLLIKIPIDEETFELIDTNIYSFRVSYSDGNNFFTFANLIAPIYLDVSLGDAILTFTIDENTADYFPRSYYLTFPTPVLSATLQPYLVKKTTSGGGGIQSVLFTRTENNKAVPNIEIRAYRIVPITGKTLMEQLVTDSAGSATFSFVQGELYTIDFLRDNNIFSSDLILQPVFSSYQFYLSAEIFTVPDENALIFDVNFSPSVDYIDSNTWADINISINVENTTISDLNILIYLDNNTLYNVIVFSDGFYALPPVSIVGATQILNVEVILTTADGLRISRSKAYSYNLSIPQRGLNEFFEALPGLVNFNRHSNHLEISTLGFLLLTIFICGAIKSKSQIDTGGTALFAMLILGVFTYMGFVYLPAFIVAVIICFALIIFARAF